MEMSKQGKQKKRGSLLHTYAGLIAGVVVLLIGSFCLTYFIIHRIYQKESEENVRAKFEQTVQNMDAFEKDLKSIYTAVSSSETLHAYMKAQNLPERVEHMESLYQFAGSLMQMNDSIEEVMVFNEKGEVTAASGTAFCEKEGEIRKKEGYCYSGRIEIEGKKGSYFQMEMPVFQRDAFGDFGMIGSVVLVVSTKKMENLMEAAQQNQDSYIAVWDQDGKELAAAGTWKDSYRGQLEGNKTDLVYQKTLSKSGWKLVNIVPRQSFMGYMNQVQMITMITYLIIFLIMAGMCAVIYRTVLVPIRRQTRFVSEFTQNTAKRITKIENNELGTLAETMNEMLDELEEQNQQIIEEERKYLELDYAKKQTEMAAYKSQINPHFMYNTLECIRGMALYHQEKEIAKLTASLSKLFRYNVKGEEMVTLREVMKNLKEYATIIDYRFMGRFTITMECREEELLEEKLPKMLVQPLVENAVLHGLEPKTDSGCVHVCAEYGEKEDTLQIRIEDDGCGMSEEQQEKLRQQMASLETKNRDWSVVHGVGMANVYMRMKLFYGEQAELKLDSVEGEGTSIVLMLPMGQQEEDNVSGISGGR